MVSFIFSTFYAFFFISIALLKDVDSPSLWGDIEISTGCHRSDGDTRYRETTTKSVTSPVVFWTSTRELRNFYKMPQERISTALSKDVDTPFHGGTKKIPQDAIGARVNGDFTQISIALLKDVDSPSLWGDIEISTGCHRSELKWEVGILVIERRQQSRLCFGLRQENLEIFADGIHASINEQLIQIYNSFFDFRLECRVGILGYERRQQSGVLNRPLQLLVQLCFGSRQGNLEIFADGIHASINEQDTRLREMTTKWGLEPTFAVTSSVVLWISTRELRNFRGWHPCKY
ncbi:LOW QUALITY PROTEIN: hypothetical protein V1477_002412 [Vespula maculifrons]|uniref:Uncharacterized protein n=1 Tax=Vespula maculifrons TaxID=7453 RepID=A0ABD2CWF2_VESMC